MVRPVDSYDAGKIKDDKMLLASHRDLRPLFDGSQLHAGYETPRVRPISGPDRRRWRIACRKAHQGASTNWTLVARMMARVSGLCVRRPPSKATG